MSRFTNQPRRGRRWLWVCLAVACVAQITWFPNSAASQPSPGGPDSLLPVVPLSKPRPAQGEGADEQWGEGLDRAPVASFIDSLKGTDTALEIIVGQGRLLTTKKDIATKEGVAVIAVGDPTVVDFEVLPNPRMLRLTGLRAGVTDLSITLANDETYSFEVHVVYDLTLLRAQLRQVFPEADLRLAQIREHIVVEGQARSPAQVTRILQTITAYLSSVQVASEVQGGGFTGPTPLPRNGRGNGREEPVPPQVDEENEAAPADGQMEATGEVGGRPTTRATFSQPQVINLIRVPGVQQVLLKVRIAELNRTGLRAIGADVLVGDAGTGTILGSSISSAAVSALGSLGMGGLTGTASSGLGSGSTGFGIFPSGDFEVILRALRGNALLRIMAEPNLVTMSGHQANFLAGGEFPIPVPQGGIGATATTTIQFKEFGVQLAFLPYVLDEDRIRLTVQPEVSSIDFALGTTLVAGGDPVPGLNTRRAATTVELRQGQTLAIAGLLQVEMSGETSKIPGLGDLPYIGTLFSNTTNRQIEKELLVLITPYLVEPMEEEQLPPLPGQQITAPNDAELYLLNRIEGRTGKPFRPTTQYEPHFQRHLMQYEQTFIHGPVGFSELP